MSGDEREGRKRCRKHKRKVSQKRKKNGVRSKMNAYFAVTVCEWFIELPPIFTLKKIDNLHPGLRDLTFLGGPSLQDMMSDRYYGRRQNKFYMSSEY